MKAALSIVLAALLIMLPVEQVLAQAAQQEAVSVQQTEPSDGAAALFRVPPLTENSKLLLRTSSERSLLNTPFADAPFAQQEPDEGWWAGLDQPWKFLMVVAVAAVFVGVIYYFIRECTAVVAGPDGLPRVIDTCD